MSKLQYLIYSSSNNPVNIKPLIIVKAASKTEAKKAARQKITDSTVNLLAILKRDAFKEDLDQAMAV